MHYEKFADGTVECIEDETDDLVPVGWSLTTLGNICTMQAGKFIAASEISPTYLDGMYACYGGNGIRGYVANYSLDGDYPVIGRQGALCGNVNMAHGKFYATEHAVVVTPMENIDLNWLYYTLIALNLNQYASGAAQPGLAVNNILKVHLMLPPTNEQKRIANTIENTISIIKTLDVSKDELTNTIQATKNKILDLAIRGKLVPQNPDDEPASMLLERIRAEKEELIKQGKIKRDKKESIIFKGDDNSYYEKIGSVSVCIDNKIPFQLTNGWRWERLGNVASIARGGSPRPIKDYLTNAKDGINWIKIGDAEQGGKFIFSTAEKIIPEGLKKTRYVKKGDFLLTNSMSFGRPYILKTDGCIHDGWLVIGDIENVFSQDFLYYALSSEFMYKSFSELAAGSTVKNLQSDTVKSVLFPIPPFTEQIRIAEYIEEIYIVISAIEKSLS